MLNTLAQVLAEGKGGTARDRPKEAGVQSYEPTNRNSIQGRVSGQVSMYALGVQHDKAPDSGDTVNAAVA